MSNENKNFISLVVLPPVPRILPRTFSALFLASQAVAAGSVECAMALGFEKMAPGSLSNNFNDRTNPLDKTLETMSTTVGMSNGPFAAQIFGNGGNEYCQKYGAKWEDIAAIASKVCAMEKGAFIRGGPNSSDLISSHEHSRTTSIPRETRIRNFKMPCQSKRY